MTEKSPRLRGGAAELHGDDDHQPAPPPILLQLQDCARIASGQMTTRVLKQRCQEKGRSTEAPSAHRWIRGRPASLLVLSCSSRSVLALREPLPSSLLVCVLSLGVSNGCETI